jgi:hypothetical protein
MRIQRSWVLRVLAVIAIFLGVRQVEAQSMPNAGPAGAANYAPGSIPQSPYIMPPGMQPGPAAGMPMSAPGGMPYHPAAYYDPSAGGPPQALSPMPATPMGAQPDPAMAQPGMPMGMGMCDTCGGYGCDACMGACDNFDFGIFRYLLPYGAGGYCAQRWFDVQADYVYLRRDDLAEPQAFTSQGQGGPTILEMDDLAFDETSGFRTTVAMQLRSGNSIEASYLAGFNWSSYAMVESQTDNLFSVMSDFGNAPPGGFDDTDAASMHMIAYSSGFDTVELNYRQRWVAPNCRVQGSWLVGVRYFNLAEDFRYSTQSPGGTPGWMDYFAGASNNMTGVQTGGDLWVCIIPGLHVGTEVKLGMYGNHAQQLTQIEAFSFVEPVIERETSDRVAFVGDFNLTFLWKLNQNWTLRGGYMAMYTDGVALAADNFNAGPPFVAGQRTPFINASGDVFYHGLTAGVEWMW